MVEIVKLLGAGDLTAALGRADLEGPTGKRTERYLLGGEAGGREQLALFHLAWDVACSAFGGRQALYERFFFGDPVRMAGALMSTYEKGPAVERVREFLGQGLGELEDHPAASAGDAVFRPRSSVTEAPIVEDA
jgi:4-hydroxyphenylacetate 3-monooxygenase